MATIKRNWDLLSEDQRKIVITEIINFFETERSQTIGFIAAESILDMFLQTTGIMLYNKGIDDAKTFIIKHIEEISIDMDISLKK